MLLSCSIGLRGWWRVGYKDLLDFDKGQKVITKRLSKSISETARLVSCSIYVLHNTYQRLLQTSVTSSEKQGVVPP